MKAWLTPRQPPHQPQPLAPLPPVVGLRTRPTWQMLKHSILSQLVHRWVMPLISCINSRLVLCHGILLLHSQKLLLMQDVLRCSCRSHIMHRWAMLSRAMQPISCIHSRVARLGPFSRRSSKVPRKQRSPNCPLIRAMVSTMLYTDTLRNSGIHTMPQQGSVKPLADDTRLTKLSRHDSSWQHQAVPHQQGRGAQPPPSQQHQIRQPCSPKPHGSRKPGTVSPPVHPPASRPPGAVAKAPAKKTAPGVTGAIEHSSLSLHQLAVASRSKLQPPSVLNSPPKRGGKAALPKQATSSHLVKLAAAVPLPASPGGIDSATSIEATAAAALATAALATAAAQPSHIPAPAVKPSRLKKPTNTSGFFSSGRSFTGAGSNNRCAISLICAMELQTFML